MEDQMKCSNCGKEYNHEKNKGDDYSSISKCPWCNAPNVKKE